MDVAVEEEEELVLPPHLEQLRQTSHWVFAECWDHEKNRFVYRDKRQFQARIARFRELLVVCSDDELEDFAIVVAYRELPGLSTAETCEAIKQTKRTFIAFREMLRVASFVFK